jgi:hypothetical protein
LRRERHATGRVGGVELYNLGPAPAAGVIHALVKVPAVEHPHDLAVTKATEGARRIAVTARHHRGRSGRRCDRRTPEETNMSPTIRSLVIPVSDLEAAKAVYTALLGAPHTDQPYYVG